LSSGGRRGTLTRIDHIDKRGRGMFGSVVWATDGSAHADRALDYAKQLVERPDGTLHVVHVVEKLVGARVAGLDAHVNEADIKDKITAQVEAATAEGAKVTLQVPAGQSGEIASLIAVSAAAVEGDVIVVGTHGRSAVVGALVGSVAPRLLQVSGRPVLAVPPVRQATHQTGAPEVGAATS
jgi:nucleotide-binding universal stress UspA family protein